MAQMRILLAALVIAASSSAFAQGEAIEASTRDAIFTLATRGYADPAKAEIRDVRKSKAQNGLGYCGEVTVEGGGGGFTVFHAILGEGSAAGSVLRLADFPSPDANRNDAVAQRLMRDFGCID